MRIADLHARVPGRVFGPGDAGYDAGRRVFAAVGEPAAVVRPGNAADVANAVTYAAEAGATLSIRGGGHGASGHGTNTGGVVVDLADLCDVVPDDDLVHVGGGARWRDVAAALAPTGLVVTSGDTASVGVGGLTLGGGIGWLVRSHGLTIDNLAAAELVTAAGQVLTVDAHTHPELFWALRGGGGNFGVVTRFTFHARPTGPLVGGRILFDERAVGQTMRVWRDLMRTAPPELNATFMVVPPMAPEIPAGPSVTICYQGPESEVRELLAPLLTGGSVVSDGLRTIAYTDLLEDGMDTRPPFQFIDQSGFVAELSDDVIATLEQTLAGNAPTVLQIRALDGAFGAVDAGATAFAHRDAEAFVSVASVLPADVPAEIVAGATMGLAPVKAHMSGMYVNFAAHTGRDVTRQVYPPDTLRRLVEVKTAHDPTNVFHQNHNVWPADRA